MYDRFMLDEEHGKSRRSFVVEALTTAAGVWVGVSGFFSLLGASGCSDDDAPTPDSMMLKYGGPDMTYDNGVDSGTDSGTDAMVTKYGGPIDGALPDGLPDAMVAKYGGPPDGGLPDAMVTKYGGPPDGGLGDAMVTKYGGPISDGMVTKYGGPIDV